MAVLVGIDEAGYGPILGPLVVSSVGYYVPDELLKADLWKVLERAVAKQKRHLAGRLLITDSKKAYSKSKGLGSLRRAVLAHCCAWIKNLRESEICLKFFARNVSTGSASIRGMTSFPKRILTPTAAMLK